MESEEDVSLKNSRAVYSQQEKDSLMDIIKYGDDGKFNKIIQEKDAKLNAVKNR